MGEGPEVRQTMAQVWSLVEEAKKEGCLETFQTVEASTGGSAGTGVHQGAEAEQGSTLQKQLATAASRWQEAGGCITCSVQSL